MSDAPRQPSIDKPTNLRRSAPVYFFHIPKTAGTSLTVALSVHFSPQDICPQHLLSGLLEVEPTQWGQYQFLSGHFYNYLYPLLPRQPDTITFLRDPISRSLSHYRHIWRELPHYLNRKAHRLGNLPAFLRDAEGHALLSNFQTRMLALDLGIVTLAALVDWSEPFALEKTVELAQPSGISDAQLLARAKARLDSFSFVGLTERMPESISLLEDRFGWRSISEMPHENVTPVGQEYGHISPDAIERLHEITALDAELYRYAEQRLSSELMSTNPHAHR